MNHLLYFGVLLWFGVSVYKCTGNPILDVLTAVNCETNTIDMMICGDINAPYVFIDDNSKSYPDDGFCMIRNASQGIDPGVIAYDYTVPLCTANGKFGGGIFFNYQDESNFDVFFLSSDSGTKCTVGYVELGTVHEIDNFDCTYTGDWIDYSVSVNNNSAAVSLNSHGLLRSSLEYAPHFEMIPIAGPLHINDDYYHTHLHIGNSTTHTVTCQDSPKLCDPCNFAYNVQSQPMYPLPDYRNFLLWYPRALEMVYTSCYFKVMLEKDDKSLINATSKVGTFSSDPRIKTGDFYGERHACITNQVACLQVKAGGSVTDGQEIYEDRTLINIKPEDTTGLMNVEVNGGLQMIYGSSIQESDSLEFSMLLDERVYGPDFGIYCHSSKSVYEAETVSENMCFNGDNNGHQPPEGGIVQKGWAVRFH